MVQDWVQVNVGPVRWWSKGGNFLPAEWLSAPLEEFRSILRTREIILIWVYGFLFKNVLSLWNQFNCCVLATKVTKDPLYTQKNVASEIIFTTHYFLSAISCARNFAVLSQFKYNLNGIYECVHESASCTCISVAWFFPYSYFYGYRLLRLTLLTPWSRLILEKLIKKSLIF
jgi:hypothetical protein